MGTKSRLILIEVEATYRRVRTVYLRVEETDERSRDLARNPDLFLHERSNAAVNKAKTQTLTG